MEQMQQTLNVNYRSGGKFCLLALSGIILGLTTPTYGQWPKHIIDDNISEAISVDVADLDGDNKLDLIVTDFGNSKIIWYQNDFPAWNKKTIDNVKVAFAFSGDMDGDDTLDVVATLFNARKLVWYENNLPTGWTQHIIDDSTTKWYDYLTIADIDNDGTLDVVTSVVAGYYNKVGDIAWYENNHPIWTKYIIESYSNGTPGVFVHDIDGDGILDVIATFDIANKVVWYKTEDNGLSWTQYSIDDNFPGAWNVEFYDISGDDTVDVIVTSRSGDKVVWYENHSPTWTQHIIATNLDGADKHWVTDVDGDGTMDVVASGYFGGDVVWYENRGGTPIIWTPHTIDANLPGANVLAVSDVDGDGINDVIVPATSSVVWYKNPYTTVAYGQSFEVYPKYIAPQQGDTLKVSAQISNPENHQVTVQALIQGKNSTFKDSLQLFDDGLHDDGIASDSIFGGIKWLEGLEEDYFDIKLRTTDSVESITMYSADVGHFTTIGPVEYAADSLAYWRFEPDKTYNPRIYLTLRNAGSVATATDITARLSALDTCVTAISSSPANFGDIPAGEGVMSSGPLSSGYYQVSFNQNCPIGTEVPFALSISSDGYTFWSDTFAVTITTLGITDAGGVLPIEFALHPAYPNPFNPKSTIQYDLPEAANVNLVVYDILGREVVRLVDHEMQPGNHTAVWDARDHAGRAMPTGIYIVRLSIPEYTRSIKMVLLK